MSAIQYLSAFRLYGWDVLLLAGAVSLLTALLKKTVLQNAPKKVYVFLPFALGILLYAVWRALVTLSAEPFTTGLAATLEGGFGCGCAATLYYVIYEQFIRKKKTDAESGTSAEDDEGESGESGESGAAADDRDTSDTGAADGKQKEATSDTGTFSPVAPLLEGYVPEETREAVAQTLEAGARQKTGEALRAFVRTTLLSAAPAATEAELALLSELVAAYLDALPKA